MRAVGWEDDNKEDDGDVDEEEVESEEEEENEYDVDASGDALANARRSGSLRASEWHKREVLVEPTATGDASPTMDAGRFKFSEKKSSFAFYEGWSETYTARYHPTTPSSQPIFPPQPTPLTTTHPWVPTTTYQRTIRWASSRCNKPASSTTTRLGMRAPGGVLMTW